MRKISGVLIEVIAKRLSPVVSQVSMISNISLFLTLFFTLNVSDAQTPPVATPQSEMHLIAEPSATTQNSVIDTQVIGVVALDFPVFNAEIVANCANGLTVKTRTNKTGEYALDLKRSQLPCMLEAAGGLIDGAENQVVMHSMAYTLGVANINPLSELALAHALAKMPTIQFAKLPSVKLPNEEMFQAGQAYVAQQLITNNLALSTHSAQPFVSIVNDAIQHTGANPNPSANQSDLIKKTLSALVDKLALSQHTLANLASVAAVKAPWAETLKPAPVVWRWMLPKALPEPLTPENNPMSNEKVALGRYLFYDIRLSGNQTFSCASCHHQDKAFTDGKPLGVGSTGEVHPRSPMALGNVAYSPTLTWAHKEKLELETQIEAPFFGDHPVEMGVNEGNKAEVLKRVASDTKYQSRFKAAFPQQDNIISWKNIKNAISSFERTLLTGNSRYDKPHGKGTPLPWSDAEERGRVLFFTTANCFQCHGNFNFNDTASFEGSPLPELRFHNTGLFNIGGKGDFPERNRGIFEFTGQASDMGKFKAPTLRNIAVTAPYMHDGSLPTLEDVLNFYGDHGRNIVAGPNAGDGRDNPYKSEHINSIKLSEQDKADIIAFLKTLTDNDFLTDARLSDPFKK